MRGAPVTCFWVTNCPRLSDIKPQPFYFAHRFCGSENQTGHDGVGFSMPHNIWELGWEHSSSWKRLEWLRLESSRGFLTPICGVWVGITQSAGSAGAVDWSVYTWPLHVALVSSSMEAAPKKEHLRGASKERAFQETRVDAERALLYYPWNSCTVTSSTLCGYKQVTMDTPDSRGEELDFTS